METYFYVAVFLLFAFFFLRILYLKNERDKNELEEQLNQDYQKIQEIEINDTDIVN